MIASVHSASVLGARGHRVGVEVHVGPGLPSFTMLGLPDESCREARDRVRAAVLSSGLSWPDRRVTVNLAPPTHRKSGSGLDLAIAVGVLVATEQIDAEALGGRGFAGELGLDGSLRAVAGVAPMVGVAPELEWVVPSASVGEASAVAVTEVRGVSSLTELVDVLAGRALWQAVDPAVSASAIDAAVVGDDLADVRGQPVARLALEVAAAGGHHLLFVGSPGAGKTMLARRLPGLLPDLDHGTALEVTMVQSAAGVGATGLVVRPPFRAPHHTSSSAALVGGGSHVVRPGEISLAHGGVLFLDEMGQFAPAVLDTLREALETGRVAVGRVNHHVSMPARFQLVGATNPCPCGEAGAPGVCTCDERSRHRYLSRLSGPLIDRFDLRVRVTRPEVGDLMSGARGESSAEVARRVARARDVALMSRGRLNADLGGEELDRWARLDGAATALLRDEMERGRLTGRGYHRVRRVARTLADLSGAESDTVDGDLVAAALSMRAVLDRRAAT